MRFILTYLMLALTLSAQTIQKMKGVQVAERSWFTETQSGKEPVIGVNAAADPSIANRVNATHTDGFAFMQPGYLGGFKFYATESGATVGNQINTLPNQRFWIVGGGGVVIGPHDTRHAQFMVHNAGLTHTGYVIKNANSSSNLDWDSTIYVGHDDNYNGTPMYHLMGQSYTTAAMVGMEVGNNSYQGASITHYNGVATPTNGQWAAKVPDGLTQLYTGPIPEYGGRISLFNSGDALINHIQIAEFTASQSGNTVTASVGTFLQSMVGKRLAWGDWERGGGKRWIDTITGFISGTQVTVSRSRTVASQACNVISGEAEFAPRGGAAAMIPGMALRGAWFTGGDSFTTKPHFLIEPNNTNTTGTWSTAGTAIGVNAASGFAGELMNLEVDRTSIFSVAATGLVAAIGDFRAGATAGFTINGRAYLNAPATGVALLSDGLGGAAMRLNMAGSTASFPSIKRNGTAINIRLADDSADAPLTAGLVATTAAAPTIASAGTIAPVTRIVFISGTATISTITAPVPISAGGGQITLIPTGVFTTDALGNIALASTAVVNRALIMTYDSGTTKWYPSY